MTTTNYPRRRAPIACNFCRYRKRRCDGMKPRCSMCMAAKIDCCYQDGTEYDNIARTPEATPGKAPLDEDVTTRDDNTVTQRPLEANVPSSEALLHRIEELEGLVWGQNTTVELANMSPPISNADFDGSSVSWLPDFLTDVAPAHNPFQMTPNISTIPASRDDQRLDWVLDDGGPVVQESPPTIPIGHFTPTSSLFTLEPVRKLVGEYPGDFFLQIETDREFQSEIFPTPITNSLANLNLNPALTKEYLAAFFSSIYPHFPIIDSGSFHSCVDRATGPDADELDTALFLVVLALGKLISNRQANSPGKPTVKDGSEYFSLAYQILTTRWVMSFGLNLSLAAGLVYAAIYLCYQERPLHSWRLVYMTSVKLQTVLPRIKRMSMCQQEADVVSRLFWACFLLECDTLAEFHLPRSGIELVIDNMPLPQFSNSANCDGLVFLAICSVRRLLNRIHRAIYDAGNPWSSNHTPSAFFSVNSLGNVCAELTRQLDTWYALLPDAIKPDLADTTPCNVHDGWLRLRYWSAKHIICRPCLVYAATLTDHSHLPAYILANSETCVESCRNYINTASLVLTERTQYTWMTIQGSLACALMITITSENPLLSHLVPDTELLLKKVIIATEPWATPGSSAECISWILKAISQKKRVTNNFHNKQFNRLSVGNTLSLTGNPRGLLAERHLG